jgi:membrane-bound lytic murein transglycosylase B
MVPAIPGNGGDIHDKMRKSVLYLLFLNIIFLMPAFAWSLSDSSKIFLSDLLVAEGLDQSQAQNIMRDPRISVRPDFVIKNLFCSSPRGTAQKPDVMEVTPRQIARGKTFMKAHAASLSAVEKRFGTSPRIITAILIIESRLATYPMPFNVVNAYVNMALLLNPYYLQEVQARYAKAYPQLNDAATIARARRKARWAAYELAHLVYLAHDLGIDPLTISGSFSGALGPAQFLPSSFRFCGIDGDGDGIADPFNLADAKFSIGHYLRIFGWAEDAPVDEKRKAVWFYNRSQVYVNTIMMIYDKLNR